MSWRTPKKAKQQWDIANVKQHTHVQTHHMFSVVRRQKWFSESFVALSFSQHCCEEVVSNLEGRRPASGVQKGMSLSCHTCSGSSTISQRHAGVLDFFLERKDRKPLHEEAKGKEIIRKA